MLGGEETKEIILNKTILESGDVGWGEMPKLFVCLIELRCTRGLILSTENRHAVKHVNLTMENNYHTGLVL